MLKRIGLLAALILLAACHSNPYSDTTGNLSTKPPERKPTPINNTYIEIDSSKVDVAEGTTTTIKVKGVVPEGTPVIRYDGLPGFVTADATGTVLTVSPKFGDANDPKNPSETTMSYLINIYLSSSTSPTATIPPQPLIVIVHHVSRGLVITGFDDHARVNEGASYQSFFTVQSKDYPQGPFTISSANIPVGVKISPTSDPTRFQVTYNPSFTTVKVTNRTGYCSNQMCLALNWQLTVLDPRGYASTTQAFWFALDVRQNPLVAAPPTVTGTLPNADVYANFEDPNGEVQPTVSSMVSTGQVSVSTIASSPGTAANNPYVMTRATWTGVPTNTKGTTQTLNLKSCVYSDVNVLNQCVTTPVNVQF